MASGQQSASTFIGARTSSAHAGPLTLIVTISLPLLAEVVRKYIYPNNAVLEAGEAVLLAVATSLILARPLRPTIRVLAWLSVSVCWALVTVVYGHQNIALGIIGLRPFISATAVLVVSVHLFQRIGLRAAAWIYTLSSAWLLLMGGVAAAQLALGPLHPINTLPEGLGADERHGIGDYTAHEYDVNGNFDVFRPTSIFLHTGKFGQVAAMLAMYCLFYRAAANITGFRAACAVTLELATLLISGQRAGIIFYLVAFLFLVFRRLNNTISRGLLVTVVAISTILVVSFEPLRLIDEGGVVALVIARIWSGFTDSTLRFKDNFMVVLPQVLDKFGLFGAGSGAFSLGSGSFGGRPLYEVVDVGTAENQWLRLYAEIGFPGVILVGWAIAWLGYLAVRLSYRTAVGESAEVALRRKLAPFYLYVLIMLFVWGFTHDVLGSTTTIAAAFSSYGLLFVTPAPSTFFHSVTLTRDSRKGSR